MAVQIVPCTLIRVDNRVHILRTHLIPHPGTRARDQTLRLELIRVEQIPAQGLCVIGLISNIAQDEDAGLLREALEAISRHCHVCSKSRCCGGVVEQEEKWE